MRIVTRVLLVAALAAGCGTPPGSPPDRDGPPPGTIVSRAAAPGSPPPGMVWIPGGQFVMGSDGPHAAPAERPPHPVAVDGFFMSARPVTNAEFHAFVAATGYVTIAERPIDADEILRQVPPGTAAPPADQLVPGALVFAPRAHVASLDDWSQWWRWTPGASWRHPHGPSSSIDLKADHPVVQIAFDDAMAYAAWMGGRLPTEAEWEFAARGGLAGAEHAWGDAAIDPDHPQAHIYAGEFPTRAADTRPAGSLAPNGFGLFDMSGNVWEWTADWYRADTYARDAERGVVTNPTGPDGPDDRPGAMAARALRGGSYLCSDVYCRGYRVSARSSAAPDSGASHIGFRPIMTVEQWRQWTRREASR